MACFRNMFGVIVLLFIVFPFELQAGITFSSQTGNVTYWSLGSTVRLPWDYDFKVSDVLSKSFEFVASRSTTIKTLAKLGLTTTKDPRVTITGNATLSFPGAQRSDNGTYTFKVNVDKIGIQSDSVLVIVLDRPTAKASCSGEGDNASCLCEGKGGNPPADTTWLKGNKKIKGPEHLSTAIVKNDITPNGEGEYTCKANSNNLTHEDSVTLSKPKDISFKSEMDGDRIKLVCQVVGTIAPAPVYLISFNGSVAKEDKNGVKYIGKEDIGQYECLAKNVLGSATKYLFFNGTAVSTTHAATPSVQISTNERVPVKHTTPPSVQMTTKEREKLISDKGTEWYISLITFICGMIVGMVLLYAIMWFRLRLSKKRDHSKPSQPRTVAGPSGEGLENASAYQELDLQNMNKGDDNYQSLRMTSRNAQSSTAPVGIENEAGYQELNEVRGNADDNYQPLNRV